MRESRSKNKSLSPTRKATTSTSPSAPRRRKSTRKMNNAENYAAVEVKRKSAKEEARYEMAERGEGSKQQRNFEKPDKPDDKEKEHVRDTLSSLPPEDLRNVAILMLLCMSLLILGAHACRFITRYSGWFGVWEYTIFIKGEVIIWTSWSV